MKVEGFDPDVDADDVPWRATRHPGIAWLPLHAGGGSDAPDDTTALIRMEPGCGYPPHEHLGVEEVLVLAGAYRDDAGTHAAGAYVRYAAGSRHAPVAVGERGRAIGPGNRACILFAVARGGVRPIDRASG